VPWHLRCPVGAALLRPQSIAGRLLSTWQAVRLTCCAVLILLEPIVSAILVPLAFLSFLVTLIFGFLIGDPRFPRWGMLAFSVGSLMLYWLFLGVMSLFMTLPPTHDR
jgi:hypothetical protein